VTGWIYTASNNVSSFFYLKKNNRQLLEQNAELQNRLYALQSYVESLPTDSLEVKAFASDSIQPEQFRFIPAEVVNLSFSGMNNFMTINMGSAEGVRTDMGVISQTGVVGVISKVSEHFSLVIPVINPRFRLSAKLSDSENYGSVSWNGKNIRFAQLQELPKHEQFNKGDTVLTSFSRIFPKDVVIGFVSGQGASLDDNFNTFDIELATDFYTIRNVLVIDDRFNEEQNTLEMSLQ
jgi:rod shape-determining protein MreC